MTDLYLPSKVKTLTIFCQFCKRGLFYPSKKQREKNNTLFGTVIAQYVGTVKRNSFLLNGEGCYMKRDHSFIRMLGVCALSLGLSASGMYACSSGSGADPDPAPGTPVTLTGQITANSSDLALASPLPAQFRNHSRQSVASGVNADVAPAPGMEITVTQVNSDGTTEELEATATSDAEGNYTLSLDAVTQTTAGQSDFYYLITATDGTVVLNSVAAPTEDMTAPVSPGTTFGAAALSNGIGGISTIPSAEQVNNLNLLNDQVLTDFPDGSIEYPSNANTPEALAAVLSMANGTAASDSQSQYAYMGVLSESNFYSIVTDATSDETDRAQYVKKMIFNGCGQPSQQPLTDLDANVIGQVLQDGITSTPTEIVAAMNAASNDPDISVDTAVSSFVTLLTNIEAISSTVGLDEADLLPLNVKRNLTAATFTSATPLDADQAVAFIETLNFGVGPQAAPCNGNINITNVLKELTEASELDVPAIAQVQVYGERMACPQATVTGEVEVYIPEGSAVTVVSTELSGGSLSSPIVGTLQGMNRYVFDDASACALFGVEATYTVTVNLSSGGPLTQTVDRNHPNVPQATVTVDGVPTSDSATVASDYDVPFPLFTWEDPADMLAGITDAPANSAVKYTYEFSYIDATDMVIAPLNTCPTVTAGALYSVSSMLPVTECDPEACAALSPGHDASDIVCRLYIQTVLVDESDNYLQVALGEFATYRYVPAP